MFPCIQVHLDDRGSFPLGSVSSSLLAAGAFVVLAQHIQWRTGWVYATFLNLGAVPWAMACCYTLLIAMNKAGPVGRALSWVLSLNVWTPFASLSYLTYVHVCVWCVPYVLFFTRSLPMPPPRLFSCLALTCLCCARMQVPTASYGFHQVGRDAGCPPAHQGRVASLPGTRRPRDLLERRVVICAGGATCCAVLPKPPFAQPTGGGQQEESLIRRCAGICTCVNTCCDSILYC